MYRYTSAPPPSQRPRSSTYLDPLPYPHHLTARSYDTSYMCRPYRAEPQQQQRQSSHYYKVPSYRPVQTPSWRYVRPVPPQQSPRNDENPHTRKGNLKKTAERRVHFDLPPAEPLQSTSRTVRIAAEEREREKQRVKQREREREREHEREGHHAPYRPPYRPPPPPRRSSSPSARCYDEKMYNQAYKDASYTYTYDARHHRTQTTTYTVPTSTYNLPPFPPHPSLPTTFPSRPTQQPLPTLPTVYIITYGASLLPSSNETAFSALLTSQIPLRHPPIPHLYTIDARTMTPPSPALCKEYSGISPLIQDIVMRDPGARRAARDAVEVLVGLGEGRAYGGWDKGMMEVCLTVCCHAGTHRSVAIAERIAQCVRSEVRKKGGGEGVVVVCRHVHRVKGRGDPF
ncbi:hypothetical protein GMOD_00006979 [Pyrenophora seminiperda CCB06]|uniref:RapZ C-terminal domain-containing protein n=1 Tax=Pyrenophora seminiperda CCB06 TaxID=1302712 RepID=A0A3M7MC02_9PLEO|nr:hypothetical protein GMOD_00006979 [Pyrenophora seminiperda CCB06]